MANLIDVDFLNNFTEVFMFLLIFALVYGILTKVDFFKLKDKGKGLNSIIAVSIALLTLISANIRAVIGTMVPWFFVMLLFFLLMMVSTMIFGTSNEDMSNLIKKSEVWTWIVIFGTIILLFSLGAGFGQNLLEEQNNGDGTTTIDDGEDSTTTSSGFADDQTTDTGDYQSDLVRTLFHPKVLGLMLIGIIGLMSAIFLTKDT